VRDAWLAHVGIAAVLLVVGFTAGFASRRAPPNTVTIWSCPSSGKAPPGMGGTVQVRFDSIKPLNPGVDTLDHSLPTITVSPVCSGTMSVLRSPAVRFSDLKPGDYVVELYVAESEYREQPRQIVTVKAGQIATVEMAVRKK